MADPLDVALAVVGALEACRIPYSVGGSLASSFSGEPRASVDADILVAMTTPQIPSFIRALGDEFYVDADSLARAIGARTSANLIHRPSGIKVDLFVERSALDRLQLDRRRRVQVAANPDRFLHMHSPEDTLLQKLYWYRRGGEVSDRQWRDAIGVILVQATQLDRRYLVKTAMEVGVSDLLTRAWQEANPDSSS